jgi:hypothetical protein
VDVEVVPSVEAGPGDRERGLPVSATARHERRSTPGERDGDQASAALVLARTLTWTRSAGRTRARSGRSHFAQPLQNALAGVTAAEQDDHQHERGREVHQSVEGGPRTVAQDDGDGQEESGEKREPGDSLACESAATDSHRGARIPPHALYGSR